MTTFKIRVGDIVIYKPGSGVLPQYMQYSGCKAKVIRVFPSFARIQVELKFLDIKHPGFSTTSISNVRLADPQLLFSFMR